MVEKEKRENPGCGGVQHITRKKSNNQTPGVLGVIDYLSNLKMRMCQFK